MQNSALGRAAALCPTVALAKWISSNKRPVVPAARRTRVAVARATASLVNQLSSGPTEKFFDNIGTRDAREDLASTCEVYLIDAGFVLPAF